MTTILGGECHQHTYYRVTILYVITSVITNVITSEEIGDRSEFREIREFRDIREFREISEKH